MYTFKGRTKHTSRVGCERPGGSRSRVSFCRRDCSTVAFRKCPQKANRIGGECSVEKMVECDLEPAGLDEDGSAVLNGFGRRRCPVAAQAVLGDPRDTVSPDTPCHALTCMEGRSQEMETASSSPRR